MSKLMCSGTRQWRHFSSITVSRQAPTPSKKARVQRWCLSKTAANGKLPTSISQEGRARHSVRAAAKINSERRARSDAPYLFNRLVEGSKRLGGKPHGRFGPGASNRLAFESIAQNIL